MGRNISIVSLILCLGISGASAQKQKPALFARNNLVAWCVVPYDKEKRNPEERAGMLKALGFTQFAWDWRAEHLPEMMREIRALRANDIKLKAVWFWVNAAEGLDKANEYILETLEQNNINTELWLSFNDRFFEGLSDQEKLKKAVAFISALNTRANRMGCTVQLYNHGGWFGEPENQVKIIKATGADNIGIVYNFHHARHQVNDFPRLIRLMKPHLTTVNINGMKEDGPIALPVGEGDHELAMLRELRKSGYNGSLGILSHVDDQDAALTLKRNLDGLKKLLAEMGENAALRSYRNTQ